MFQHSHLLSVHRNVQFAVPGAQLSCPIWRIYVFNKINAKRKCQAKLFATAKLCITYTTCPSSCSSYCSHSFPQYCCMGQQKSPYLLKALEQRSPIRRSLTVQEAEYKLKVVLFQGRFLSSPLKLYKPLYFWNCSVTCPKICSDVGRKQMFVYKRKKKSTNNQTAEYNENDENTTAKDLQPRAISELKIGCSLKDCVTKRLWYILPVFFCA